MICYVFNVRESSYISKRDGNKKNPVGMFLSFV